MNEICGRTFDEERALYHLQNAVVAGCTFAGPADGESALKECRGVTARDCRFALRYPLWHADGFTLEDSVLETTCRAPIWYARGGQIARTRIDGIKCLRECRDITLRECRIDSPEFGWKCHDVILEDCTVSSEYFLLELVGGRIDRLQMAGKYSFQYTKDLTIENSVLDTKDAFWHAENVTVRHSTVKGEYLGWYSRGLTLIDCHIIGTQPLCYCEDLTLINCTMENTDLAFEYSDVQADVRGSILSVKNPRSGRITADDYGEIILENAVMATDCAILRR